jgi:co-chaperonin GroES (HSP10)
MKNEIEMVANNILVYVELPKTETEAGIIVNEETAAQMRKDIVGDIIAIGPDVSNFKEGDKILLPPHGNTPVSYKGDIYHVFRETSIFAKINIDV